MNAAWKITILVNNYTMDSRYRAEHGLALLLERISTGDLILFDGGQSAEILLYNVRAIGVDLNRVTTIVLSHGHYDHTGGLKAITAEIPRKVAILAHPNAFTPKVVLKPFMRSIGTTLEEAGVDGVKTSFFPAKNDVALFEDLWVTGEIPRLVETDREASAGFFRSVEGELIPDAVSDDKSIVITKPGQGFFLVCGCCHSGLVNTLRYVKSKSQEKKVLGILGGFHTVGASAARIEATFAELRGEKPAFLAPIHCSGARETALFHQEFGDDIVKFLSVGDSIEV